VDVNEPPIWNTTFVALNVAENAVAGTSIGGGLRAYVTDPECDNLNIPAPARQQLQWAITAGNSLGYFELGAATGALTVRVAALNFEDIRQLNLTVVVTDTGTPAQTASSFLIVTVADVNEPPVFPAGQSRSVPENAANGTVLGTALSATDPEGALPLAWTITAGNNASNLMAFAVGSNSGVLTVASTVLMNYESVQGWTITVTVRDAAGNFAASQVLVSVTDVNEAPVWPAGASTLRAVAERSANGTSVGLPIQFSDPDRLASPSQSLSYSLLGTSDPAGNFQIDASTGLISVKAVKLPFKSSFSNSLQVVTVVATDSGSPAQSARQNITIQVR
jgi:hypothetical protein